MGLTRRKDRPNVARRRPGGAWRREVAEFAALFVAAGIAHLFSAALGHRESGAVLLIGLGGTLCVIVVANLWWTHRRTRPTHGEEPVRAVRLWRVRAGVRETPGQLAALAAATAATGGTVMSLHTQADTDGTVDEFYVQMPAPVPAETLVTALTAAGGRAVTARPATMHELVDPVTRALLLAASVREDAGRLPAVLATLLDAHLVHAADRREDRETLSLVSPEGRAIRLRRPGMPFTASETGRALAVLEHARRACPCDT